MRSWYASMWAIAALLMCSGVAGAQQCPDVSGAWMTQLFNDNPVVRLSPQDLKGNGPGNSIIFVQNGCNVTAEFTDVGGGTRHLMNVILDGAPKGKGEVRVRRSDASGTIKCTMVGTAFGSNATGTKGFNYAIDHVENDDPSHPCLASNYHETRTFTQR